MARAHSQEVKRGNELQKQLAAASRKDADHEENLDLEAAKREHAAEREKWAKERAVMARQLSAEAKRGNDLERQLALATSRKGGDAEELAAVKKKLFAANAEAKKTEARFNAQESRHRLELRNGRWRRCDPQTTRTGERPRRPRAPSKPRAPSRPRTRSATPPSTPRAPPPPRSDRSRRSSPRR